MEEFFKLMAVIVPQMSGPASGILVSLIILGFFGYIILKYLIPSIQTSFTLLTEQHKEDRAAYMTTIDSITKHVTERIDVIEVDLKVIKEDIHKLVD